VNATLRNSCGVALAGAPVHFAILSGPNAGGSGDRVTDAGGAAAVSYSSDDPGTDTIRATVTNPAGTIPSNTVTVTWVGRARMTGRAFALWSRGLVAIAPTPDTGPVSTTMASTVAPPCVLTISGPITAHTLCARVVTSLGPATSTATASVQDARIGLGLLPVIRLGLIQSSSRTTCAGSTGQTTILSLTIGGTSIRVNLHPAPNTVVNVAGIRIVLNEQVPVPGGLTVNAVHVVVPGLLNVILSSATSDIHRC
jgi:hypothetical protein